jgi:hypothetical protein
MNQQLLIIISSIKEKEVDETDILLQNIDSDIKSTKERNNTLVKLNHDKGKILSDTLNFFIKYDKKITDIVNSIYVFSLGIMNYGNKKKDELIFKNKEKNMTQFKFSQWNTVECNFIIH